MKVEKLTWYFFDIKMDNECIISSNFSNHKMKYFIHFELALKRIEGFCKTTLRLPLYGNNVFSSFAICFRYTIQSNPLEQVRVLVPMF